MKKYYEENQSAKINPKSWEIVFMSFLALMLAANLWATIYAANYDPDCIPVIVSEEEK